MNASSRRVLNVGGSSKREPLPPHFNGWEHVLLDLSPGDGVDLVHDARELTALPPAGYDAVYCCHTLEHFYEHEIGGVLKGFQHVLRPDGFIHVIVPDVQQVMALMVQRRAEPDDEVYRCPVGPVRYCDILYGFAPELVKGGTPYAHKFGFSPRLLAKTLTAAGFGWQAVIPVPQAYELHAFATPTAIPAPWVQQQLGMRQVNPSF